MPLRNQPESCPTPTERRRRRRRSPVIAAAAIGGLLLTGLSMAPAYAAHPEVSLPGSNFEIDANANLAQDDPSPSIDWASVAEVRKLDKPTGATDDSFGQGSKEDTPVPSVVDGSIPPNKSDLKTFGSYLETAPNGTKFLHLYWHRVQDPSGTTNMDFEFNQSKTLSGNGVTPVRTAGDLLIQYDLSQGGTNPVLWLSRWVATGAGSQCEASNATPCWGKRVNLTSAGNATGSINTSAIAAGAADGLGAISARTFGEASVNFTALTGGAGKCISFGSAYLKSRSSDSFTAAMKDFIAPAALDLSSCAKVIIRKVTDPNPDPSGSTFAFTTANFAAESATNPTFGLKNGENKTYSDVFLGTGISVSENLAALPAGWKLGSIDCSASTGVTPTKDLASGKITFDLDATGDIVDCTYYNETGGTVRVHKVTDPSPDPSDSSFGYSTALKTLGGAVNPTFDLKNGGTKEYTDVLLGTGLTITEDDLPNGWKLSGVDCSASTGVTPVVSAAKITFDIDDADDVLDCTYTNESGGTVIIHKVTQPNPDPSGSSFGYTSALSTLDGAVDPTFSLKNGETKTYSNVLFGTGLTVTEGTLPDGWELTDLDCDASVGVTPDVTGATVTFAIDDADDVLECTYTNRARASLTIEKITDDGSGAFDFTSGTLDPSPFTLTTSGAGAAGADSRSFSDLDPGTYDVAETVPPNWHQVGTPTCTDGSTVDSIALSAGEDTTCTFHNARNTGAIKIVKTHKHAADGPGSHPESGVEFTITNGTLDQPIVVTTNAQGIACVPGLLVSAFAGTYTVTETVPAGEKVTTDNPQLAAVATSEDDCSDVGAAATVSFENMPLTDLTVSVDSQVPGGTYSSIECDVAGSDTVALGDQLDDPSVTVPDLEPGTYTCTIVIDP
ncbi:prealbumin-like fold domain-containing protein [Agromyces endophyticus]|uniref:prealbumin-like fold domain-containing protein n=1 Tax=Agromyces sp. H17E-10 TaxID=2932244 RepID=UPI001FD2F24C|nr:DUF5979 domain-containing protein [Agromyces sp. H17E-10]UOQ88328.1 prealbumin-like fold domain-containing protein [Agromyces sp. H17E-10]